MISSSHLSKVLFFIIFFVFFAFHHSVGEEEQPADIWKKVQEENRQNNQNSTEKDIKVKRGCNGKKILIASKNLVSGL